MKTFLNSVAVFSAILSLVIAGCGYMGVDKSQSADAGGLEELGVYSGYSPAEISILPLTRIGAQASDKGKAVIQVYVSLLDGFGSQIKAPAVFRFELYERISRSAEPKGKRVVIWLDFDLQGPGDNNHHWQDFLRAYKFDLEFKPQKDQNYVLQVTCLCPGGRRLLSQSNLAVAE